MLSFIKKIFTKGPVTDYKKLYQDGARIIDVRSAAEFKEGHIPGAVNIPLERVGNQLAALKATRKPIITCCRSGSRSAMAKRILGAQGLEVYNGGGWSSLYGKIKG
ncbi:MAG TPA: rhodanese-like domain-containing protein [Ferruginibacter sp.]|nr:rhodanese-like domain-containing protein [Ferruginibacter sp.]